MGTRRKARELALQYLYQVELTGRPADAFESFCAHFEVPGKSTLYARELVLGVRARWDEINRLIAKHAENWRIERMSIIDRNIIRIAVFELCFNQEKVPSRVIINEAIEVAKLYGSEESAPFINGILDAVNKIGEQPADHLKMVTEG